MAGFLNIVASTYFRNGGDEEFYIGSADAMMRNLEHRLKVLAPVEDVGLRAELRKILDIHLADHRNAWDTAFGWHLCATATERRER